MKKIELDIDLSTFSWSATSLKVYLECKRKFYYKYIQKINEHHFSLMPAGFEIGNIIHKALERVYNLERFYLNENKLLQAIYNEINNNNIENSFLLYELEIWKKRLKKFALKEIERFKNQTYVYDTEKSFNFMYKGTRIKGVIDRIDKTNLNKYQILDYKTSKI